MGQPEKFNPFYFDYRFFEKILINELRQAFISLHEQHIHQVIYLFGLQNDWSNKRLYPCLLSEEMLNMKIEQEYKAHRYRYYGFTKQNMRWYLRYNEPEQYQQEKTQLLKDTDKELHDWHRLVFGLYYDAAQKLGYSEAHELREGQNIKLRNSCINVLKALDSEGIFGQGEARLRVILMTWIIYRVPQWDDIVELNPPEVVHRYRLEDSKASGFDKIVERNEDRESIEYLKRNGLGWMLSESAQ